jgi:hypothetical protein
LYIGGTKCTWKEARRRWAGFLEQDLPRIDLGEIRIDLEKAPLTRKALRRVAVNPGCTGLYGARGLYQRVEEELSPAGYDADLDEIYGVARAGGLRV